jgi:DNA-binding transcriptional LysR family regulator
VTGQRRPISSATRRHAEVTPDRVAQPGDVADRRGVVEVEVVADLVHLLAGGVRAGHGVGLVPGHDLAQHERAQGDEEDERHGRRQPAHRDAQHVDVGG